MEECTILWLKIDFTSPATIAIIEGRIKVGLSEEEIDF